MMAITVAFLSPEAFASHRNRGVSFWRVSDNWLSPAEALPSFARQTGQPCGTCHTDFPALTPFGRRFKLLGYTAGGGEYRTTPFPSFPTANDWRGQADKMRAYAKALDSGKGDSDNKEYVPPVSMMTGSMTTS